MESLSTRTNATKTQQASLRGQVVYIRAFDLAYDMKRQRIPEILGQKVQEYLVGPSKPGPKTAFFYQPHMVVLPPKMYETPVGPLEVSLTIKVYNVGAVSIQVRTPFAVSSIEELVKYYGLGLAGNSIEAEVLRLAEQVRRELEPYLVRPVSSLEQGEDYTVFCIYQLPAGQGNAGQRTEDWLMENRRAVAALLTQENNPDRLSDQEAAESTERYLTYYESDLVVPDWDAALVVGEQDSLEEIIHIMELANVQLAELAAYDRVLDGALEVAYRDLARSPVGRPRGQPQPPRDSRRYGPAQRRTAQHHQILRRLAPGEDLPESLQPFSFEGLERYDQRQAPHAGGSLSTAPPGLDQLLDDAPGNHDRPAVHPGCGIAVGGAVRIDNLRFTIYYLGFAAVCCVLQRAVFKS